MSSLEMFNLVFAILKFIKDFWGKLIYFLVNHSELDHSLSLSGQAIYSLRPSTHAQWQYGYHCSSKIPCS